MARSLASGGHIPLSPTAPQSQYGNFQGYDLLVRDHFIITVWLLACLLVALLLLLLLRSSFSRVILCHGSGCRRARAAPRALKIT